MKICKSCGELNTNESLYCCNCGKSDFVAQEEVVCPHCGTRNDRTFAHCVNCGGLLAPADEGFTPVPVDLRDKLTDVYDGMSAAIPSETAQCPKCGAIVPLTAIFCQKCGSSVADLHEHRVVKRKVCPHCGRFNTLEAIFCTYCYCSLAEAGTAEMQLVHESKNLGELTVRQSFLENTTCKMLVCPNCGTLNEQDEAFCLNCGLKLEVEPVKKYCPNCGAENSADSLFCAKCRYAFEGDEPDQIDKWVCPVCEHANNKEDVYCSHCGQKRLR